MATSLESFAPVPDFRYVGLEPLPPPALGVAATSFGLGAGVTLALSGGGGHDALLAGALAALMSGIALRGAGATATNPGTVRMAIVPWGVLIEARDAPRVLRWAAVRSVEVVSLHGARTFAARGAASSVVVATERERFVGSSLSPLALDALVRHLAAYTAEQATSIALDLDGARAAEPLESECEAVLEAAALWFTSGRAARVLDLPPGGYRTLESHAKTDAAVAKLGGVLRDRTRRPADARAFAAVLAAELRAYELVPDLVALTECPHPVVAAFARQAARKLGVPASRTGSLDELGPFLTWGRDRARLDEWLSA